MAARSDTASLTARSRAVAAFAREAAETEDPTAVERLEMELGDLRSLAREQMQERFQQDFLGLASKLEDNGSLDERDRGLLAVIITGAATLYLKNEDDVDAWRQEIRRLAGALEEIPDPDQDGASGLVAYLQAQATVEEAMRVVPDLRVFLQEGERLKRFETATGSIDREERRYLARVIRDKLASPNR
jgi:hypothetical protein